MSGGAAVKRRPAHRPSRRQDVIEAATKLFAETAYDEVTTGQIAEAASMTPAAVYYHFASKDQILVECVRDFAAEFVARARGLGASGAPLDTFMMELVEAVRSQRRAAKVFFIGSAGVSLVAENHRREVRSELGELLSEVARRERPEIAPAEAAVIGVGLVSLLEVSVVSMLATDDAFCAIGARRMSGVVVALARHLVGSG